MIRRFFTHTDFCKSSRSMEIKLAWVSEYIIIVFQLYVGRLDVHGSRPTVAGALFVAGGKGDGFLLAVKTRAHIEDCSTCKAAVLVRVHPHVIWGEWWTSQRFPDSPAALAL